MVTVHDDKITLDNVDRGILHELQHNARAVTHEEISTTVGVSPSTVRNRISQLENTNVIDDYTAQLNYEQAGYPLRVQFICTAPTKDRSQSAQQILEVRGVITIHEMLTSEHNLIIEVVATDTNDLAEITQQLSEHDLTIHSSEIIANTYSQPFSGFDQETVQVHSPDQDDVVMTDK